MPKDNEIEKKTNRIGMKKNTINITILKEIKHYRNHYHLRAIKQHLRVLSKC